MAKGFRHGAGGSNPLNFKVVGNPKPTAPKDNTVWVDTGTPITGYVFSVEAPANPFPGMIWISTGKASNVKFNALKKEELNVYPSISKQYLDGVWYDMYSMVYVNGAWTETIPEGALYWKGDERTDITGGWTAYAYKSTDSSSTEKKPTATKNSHSITLSLTGGSTSNGGSLFTEKTIDLSGVNYVYINVTEYNCSSANHAKICTASKKATGYTDAAVTDITGVGKYALDVSSLSSAYIAIRLQGVKNTTSSITFDTIHKE